MPQMLLPGSLGKYRVAQAGGGLRWQTTQVGPWSRGHYTCQRTTRASLRGRGVGPCTLASGPPHCSLLCAEWSNRWRAGLFAGLLGGTDDYESLLQQNNSLKETLDSTRQELVNLYKQVGMAGCGAGVALVTPAVPM